MTPDQLTRYEELCASRRASTEILRGLGVRVIDIAQWLGVRPTTVTKVCRTHWRHVA